MASTFVSGIAFPFKKSPTSFPARAVNDDLIKQSLVQIVMTNRGERIMRPTFGTNTLAFLFDDIEFLQSRVQEQIGQSIADFEPRVSVTSIDVETEPDQYLVQVTINYIVLATRQPDTVNIRMGT